MENKSNYWGIPEGLDVTNFNFDWRPDPYDKPYIHQFGTQHQKTSGPRYIRNNATQIKYRDEQHAVRLPNMSKWILPKNNDVEKIEFDYSWHHDETEPPMNYIFGDQYRTCEESGILMYKLGENLPLKFIEYPKATVKYKQLDIIFLSNGETGEQNRYDRLCDLAKRKVTWVKNIQNREHALKTAAVMSTTSWFLLFPGKLYADENFDFDFRPLRYHAPKHYIFYAKNPVNDLVYGHQAAVCYNKQLVLDTANYGLDFTMSAAHDVVPMISGIAEYNSDIIMTWRTAFRESIKLCAENSKESIERLNVWISTGKGKNCEWSLIGAQDGIEFFDKVNGDPKELIKSFMWQWLDDYYKSKYK